MDAARVNIYDVAQEAEVSISTVSRVLRGAESVSPETRRRVQEVIDRLHYCPSSIARGMTTSKTNALGIVLPKMLNPFYAMIYTGAFDEAVRHGYSLNMFLRKDFLLDPQRSVALLAERRLDGAIIYIEYLPHEADDRLREILRNLKRHMPLVLIGCVPQDLDFPAITFDMAEILRQSVAYLVGLGHERIAFIGGLQDDQDPMRRDVGYEQGLRDAKLPYVASYRVYGDGTAEAGEAALDRLLDSLQPAHWPTAVIALNDMVAMGCLSSARRHGLRLPEDLSLIGCDNLLFAPHLFPPLTSVNLNQQRLGEQAVQLLLSGEKARRQAEWSLIERASCSKPAG
ncbi:MAG: LacI family DNA-binding transcriptional regulator [Clostridia bacterium]|nr:LacI family DNA-binding transcriptional regulator [Clostridia bacterium]